MSNRAKNKLVLVCLIVALAVAVSVSGAAQNENKKNEAGEQFFILSSINAPKNQLVLQRPTQVTILMLVTDKTSYLDENGKPLRLADLRAGDTVWVTSSELAGVARALRIRRGPMTVQELHRLYLDFPQQL
ncbi:MAG: hypothetical protein WBC04_26705 [Candidatus Acidiferrales bacterium]